MPDHGNNCQTVGPFSRSWEHCQTMWTFARALEHFPDCFPDHGNICLLVGTFSGLWEHFLVLKNIFFFVVKFARPRQPDPILGKILQNVKTFTRSWEYILDLRPFYFPDRGNICQTVGILPDRGKIFQSVETFSRPWEYLPHRGNIYPTKKFTRPWEYLLKLEIICQAMEKFTWRREFLPDCGNI